MKNIIYLIIIGILLLASGLVLMFYYTQDFSENFWFPKALGYTDLILKTQKAQDASQNTITYLSSAEATVGELTLENKGYFTQKYTLPQIFGCIDIKQPNDEKRLKLEIQYVSKEDSNSYNDYYNTPIEIKVGEKKSYKLKATSYGNYMDTPISLFSKENKITIDLYKVPKKESNPLGDNYYNYKNYDCSNLDSLENLTSIRIDLEAMPDSIDPLPQPANPPGF